MHLQDLAVMYVDERDAIAMLDQGFPQAHEYTATEMMALLFDIAASRPVWSDYFPYNLHQLF